MLIAIETIGRCGSVAAVDPATGAVRAVRRLATPRGQAAELVPVLDSLCREVGLRPADVATVAIAVGPGGYTGLRVGVTTAKAWALATGCRLVAVGSEAATTARLQAWCDGTLLPWPEGSASVEAGTAGPLPPPPPEVASVSHLAAVWDAKHGTLSAAVFARAHVPGDLPVMVQAPRLATPAEWLATCPRPVLIGGEGAAFHAGSLAGPGVHLAPEGALRPDAVDVARVGIALMQAGTFADADTLVPVYLRRPEAEELWDKRYGPAGRP